MDSYLKKRIKQNTGEQDKLQNLKKMLNDAYEYEKDNYNTYERTRNFLFISNIDEKGKMVLNSLGDPTAEFNILVAYVARILGEFSKHQIGVFIKPKKDNPTQEDLDFCKFLGGHIKYIIDSIDNYEVFRDVITGGFSSIKIYIDYKDEDSFNFMLMPKRSYDPTLVFFDPLATEKTKEDARYYGEIIPITKKKAIEEYKIEDISSLNIDNITIDEKNKGMVLICHLYVKEYKKQTRYLLDNGMSVSENEYQELLSKHTSGEIMEKTPEIIKKRTSRKLKIVRYEFCNNKILRVRKTNFKKNSFIFVDGNSTRSKQGSEVKMVAIPMIKYAINAQMLLNRTGQLMIKFFETLIHGKFIYPVGAIPTGKEQSYEPQQLQNVPYNQYDDKERPLNRPELLQNPSMPPEIAQIFTNASSLVQNIMGTYDAALGINDNQLSGVAIYNGSIQSNATVKPYLNNFLYSYNCLADVIAHLIKFYYKGPDSLPYFDDKGQKKYYSLSDSFIKNYNSDAYDVEVKASFNFELQKTKSINDLISLSKVSPLLADIVSKEGLPYILENYQFDGSEQFKLLAQERLEKMQQQSTQPQQMPPELQIQFAKLKNETEKIQNEHQKMVLELQKFKEKMALENKKIDVDILSEESENRRADEKLKTEKIVHALDAHRKNKELNHKMENDHFRDIKEYADSLKEDKSSPMMENQGEDEGIVQDINI
jgi:hypothetical protein